MMCDSSAPRPRLSVVIPTRNRPGHLARLLTGLLPQLCDDVEVLIHDDASDPPISATHATFLNGSAHIRSLRSDKPVGAAEGRNRCLANARGRWIAFLDDDCLCPENHVSETLSLLSDDIDAKGYLLRPKITLRSHADPRPLHVMPGPDGVGQYGWRLGTPMILIHRRHLERVGGFDARLPRWQDTDLAIRLSRFVRPAVVDRAPIYVTYPPGISSDWEGLATTSEVMLRSYSHWFHDRPVMMAEVHRYVAMRLALAGLLAESNQHLDVACAYDRRRLRDVPLKGLLRFNAARFLLPHVDAFLYKYLAFGILPR